MKNKESPKEENKQEIENLKETIREKDEKLKKFGHEAKNEKTDGDNWEFGSIQKIKSLEQRIQELEEYNQTLLEKNQHMGIQQEEFKQKSEYEINQLKSSITGLEEQSK